MNLARFVGLVFLIGTAVEAQADCLTSWGAILNPGPQETKRVEAFRVNGVPVVAIEFSPQVGDFQKKYAFFRMEEDCIVDAVTFGSYEVTTKFSREAGTIGPDERSYHADYYTNGEHATLGFFRAYPNYEQARNIAGRYFLGEIKPRSSSRHSPPKRDPQAETPSLSDKNER